MNLGEYIAYCLIQESTSPYIVYFDMDDTLTNYSGQINKTKLTPKDTVKPENVSFWENMEWLKGSEDMLHFSTQFFNTKILTRTPDLDHVKQAKKEWIKNNIGDIEVITVRRGSNKAEYATPNSILIDDKQETINKFNKAGGIGILFNNNPEYIIQELKKYYDPFYMKEDKIPGGLAQNKTLEDIAKKHIKGTKIGIRRMLVFLKEQLWKGVKIEMEHTTDENIAEEIAMDHLWEDPKYYDKLEKVEINEGKYHDKLVKMALRKDPDRLTDLGKEYLPEPKFTSDFKKYISYINELVNYVCEDLQIERPEIKIINSTNYTQENHSFGGYQPGQNKIFLVIKDRNCSDVCRTLTHELKHAQQDQQGVLTPESGKDGSEHENECNSYAGKVMREFNRKYPEILTLVN